MRHLHLLPLLQLLPFAFGSDESCVSLTGIEIDGDGQTALNLEEIRSSMSVEIFDFSNPVIPTLAACSSGESPPLR